MFFDLVDLGDDVEDPSGDAGVVFAGFVDFASDVGKAGDGGDVEGGMSLDEGAVGA